MFYQISLSLLQIFHTVLIGVTSWLACVCCFRQELCKSPIYKGKFKEKLLLGTVKLDGYLSYFASIIDPIIGKKGIIGLGGHFEDNKNKPHEISFNYKCHGINIIGIFEYMPKSNTMWFFDILFYDEQSLFDIQNEERISMLKTSCNSIEQILNSSIAIKEEHTNDLHSLRVRYKIFLDMENEENYDILVNYNEEKTYGMVLYQKNGTFLIVKYIKINQEI